MEMAKDKYMIEEGCMLINKGIRLGTHALEELAESETDQNAKGIGCYMLAQSIELLLKGLCNIFGETPPSHHIIKHPARMLYNIYEHKVPELNIIIDDLIDISNNSFAYVIQTWQVDGRYYDVSSQQSYIDKAELIYCGLKRFIYSYGLHDLSK